MLSGGQGRRTIWSSCYCLTEYNEWEFDRHIRSTSCKCGSCTKLDLSWNICDHQVIKVGSKPRLSHRLFQDMVWKSLISRYPNIDIILLSMNLILPKTMYHISEKGYMLQVLLTNVDHIGLRWWRYSLDHPSKPNFLGLEPSSGSRWHYVEHPMGGRVFVRE